MSRITAADIHPQRGTVVAVIAAACLISLIAFGARSSFGLYLEPMTVANQWSRETFALAIAIQNLLWGVCVPVAGVIADRYGPRFVIALGAIVYAAGVVGMAASDSAIALYLTAGILVGLGVAFTSFSIALAAIARVVGPERRSLALGFGTAAGSLGQVVFSPVSQTLISNYGWFDALALTSLVTLVIIPLAFMLRGGGRAVGEPESNQALGDAVTEAINHRGYLLLTVGFFVCGFHVAFISVHLPAYVTDLGLSPQVGAYAIAIVGFFNILGTLTAGAIGQQFSKKMSLSAIYFARALVILAFLMAPVSNLSIYLFAASIGLLWLSTVPLTTGIVAQVFGMKFMATLFGIVFLSHQLGSFFGVWMGGVLYDRTGSYDLMWVAGVFFGIFAAIVHLPINERPLPRLAASQT